MLRPCLYLDIDDTLITESFHLSGFDLRPAVISQLSVLVNIFQCKWLTHWDENSVEALFSTMYGAQVYRKTIYCNWRAYNLDNKAPAVLEGPEDFYWLEDPHSTGDLSELSLAGKADRYICVEPHGLWGFTRALRILFSKANITSSDIIQA